MQILPAEIDSIEECGMLDGTPAKMIRTKGGFWIMTGRPKGKIKEEALGAGSHPAIVKYNVEKQYPGFEPSMMKSELLSDNSVVDKHSHYLSEDLRKSGHDLYSIQKDNSIEFQITKNNVKVTSINAIIENNSLKVNNLDIPKEFTRAMAGATAEKALASKVEKISLKRK